MFFSLKSHDLGSRLDLDCWSLLDASNQVRDMLPKYLLERTSQMRRSTAFLRQKHAGLAAGSLHLDYDFIALSQIFSSIKVRFVVDTRTVRLTVDSRAIGLWYRALGAMTTCEGAGMVTLSSSLTP